MSLKSDVNCGNWVVVNDPLHGRHVRVAFIDKSCYKLSSNRNLSFTLVEEIADKICSHDVDFLTEDNENNFFLVAARNERWKVVRLRISVQEEFQETIDHVIVLLQKLDGSDKLSSEMLFCVSSFLRKKTFVCHQNVLRSLLTQTAARLNCWGLVPQLLSGNIDINTLDDEGMGVLHRLSMCTVMKHDDVLLSLLKNGADVNLTNIDKDTPLHVAAKYRNWRMMIKLLRQGAKGDIANKENRTVLHILADCVPSTTTPFQKNIENIFTLLNKTSLHIDAIDNEGNTALHVAVRRRKSLIAEKLLTIGARADVVDAVGRTVLHIMATQTHKYSSSLWEQIVKCGEKLEIQDCEGNTAFQLASIHENWHFMKMFTDTFVSKTDGNHIKDYLSDELRAAVEGRRWNVVKWIVKYCTDINKPDSQGCTLLQTLAQFKPDKNVDDAFSLLVDRGADTMVRTQEGENLLQLSVRHNNWLVAERLVRMGFGFCELNSEGRPGLLQRLLEQNTKQPTSLLFLLCKNTANNTVRTQSGDTLLQLAAKHGNIAVVKYLIRKSCRETLNKCDSEGFNILHRLMQHQYEKSKECRFKESSVLSVVKLLLSKGADLLSHCTTGDTILHLAAKHNYWEIVNHLLELKFDVNEADSEGLCLLHRLVKSEKENFRCSSCYMIENASYRLFQKLLSKGADPSIRTQSGDHVVHLAARQGNWTIVLHLFSQETTVLNELDSEGFNILHRLIKYNVRMKKVSLLEIPVKRGVNINIPSPHGGRALNMAVKAHQWSFARLLVEIGADLDSHDPEGNTVLHLTAKMNNWSFVVCLLKKGAHAKFPDSEGFTVLHRCINARRNTCGQLLQDCDTAMDLILNSDVDVTIRDPEGNLAIHLAAMIGDMTLVLRLLNTPVNLDLRDSEGFTLLMRALQNPSAESERVNSNNSNNNTLSVIKQLLDSGVDTEARSPDGMTAFEMAVQCNNWPAILALIPQCEVKLTDNISLTGAQHLHKLAEQKGIRDKDIRSFTNTLLEHGLNINELDSDGHSPLILAAKHKNWDCVVVLLQHGAEANVNVDNKPLLHFIVSNHRDISRSVLNTLLDAIQSRGVDFNSLDYKGRTILFKHEVCSTVYRQDPSDSLFCLLVHKGVNPLVADSNGHSLLRFALDLYEDVSLNVVKFLVQIGVTTHQPRLTEAVTSTTLFSASASSDRLLDSISSPTQAAFEIRNVQAFKLLVESGASANKELFKLSAQYKAEYVVRSKTKAEQQMLDILHHAASQPRSLKSLCRLTVSHALGCGLRRKERILTLPIPPSLQRYILFCDILSEDFLTSKEETQTQVWRRSRLLLLGMVVNHEVLRFSSIYHPHHPLLFPLLDDGSIKDQVFVSVSRQPTLTSIMREQTFCPRADRASKRSQTARAKQHVKNFVRVQTLSRPRRFLADRGVPPPHTLSRSPHQRKRVTKRKH